MSRQGSGRKCWKYDAQTLHHWWLRTSYSGSATSVRVVLMASPVGLHVATHQSDGYIDIDTLMPNHVWIPKSMPLTHILLRHYAVLCMGGIIVYNLVGVIQHAPYIDTKLLRFPHSLH